MAFDSRADDFGPPAWLTLNSSAFEFHQASGSSSALSKSPPVLRQQNARNHAAVAFDNTKALAKTEATDTRQRLIQRAQTLIGTPYKWGGVSESKGFDCSGLLVYLFRREAQMELPRTTTSMFAEDYLRVSRQELQPGDAVFFANNGRGRVDHVGLYIGDNRFIHAPRTGATIRIDSLDNRYWNTRYSDARRFDTPSSS